MHILLELTWISLGHYDKILRQNAESKSNFFGWALLEGHNLNVFKQFDPSANVDWTEILPGFLSGYQARLQQTQEPWWLVGN